MRTTRTIAAILVCWLVPSAVPPLADPGTAERTLTFAQRVEARRAIESVLWSHRLWPVDNGSPKPPLDAWLPAGALEREIDSDLRLSNALARYWGRPVTHAALQAELDRMTRDSQAPAVLHEIFDALNGDALVAAEVLARHSLVERLAREAFAYDGRIHGTARYRAASQLRSAAHVAALKLASDRFTVIRYERATGAGDSHDDGSVVVRRLSADEWEARFRELGGLRARPLGTPGPLEERELEFIARALVAADADQFTVATAVWSKTPFDQWWASTREQFAPELPAASPDYALDPLAPGNPCTDNTWYPLKRDVPSARSESVVVWTGAEMIVWGGYSGSGALATGGRYRPDTDTWVQMSTLGAPSARRRAAGVWTGTQLVVWGGDNGAASSVATNTGGRYDPALDTWTPTNSGTAPAARTYPTAVWTGSRMVVWGGVNPTTGVATQTGGVYDPVADQWSDTATSGAPLSRYGHTAVWLGGEMIVWGGTQGTNYMNSGGRYNPATNTWLATTTSGAPGARVWHTAVVFAGRMLVWGGERTGTTTWNTGSYYVQDGWQPVSTTGTLPAGREHHAAVVTDDPNAPGNHRMVVFGGQAFNGSLQLFELNDGGVFRQLNDDWLPISPSGAPSARAFTAAVSIGRDMIVWGGQAAGVALGDGRRYDPFADAWSGVSNSGSAGPVPSARERHTLVSTGSEMLVWGGLDSVGFATGNSKYTPATDAWTALPETDAPTLRYWHTGVWTGTHMLIWGGDTPSGVVNTGAEFDLFGWVAMDPTNAPAARRRHTAVWGSHSMMIWGGEAGSTLFNDGKVYNFNLPLSDSWGNTMAPVALGGRVQHTAVWNGTNMLIFGGASSSSIWGDGASYKLLTNSWTMLPTSNAPSPRYRHAAVSTNDAMIVWGGSGPSALADGASYSYAANTWETIPLPGIAGRSQLPSVWTGSEMIVWSGLGSSAAQTDGARYNPAFHGWTSMTAIGAPPARYSHPAARIGGEMMTWGGLGASGAVLSSGGRYCASVPDLSGFEAATDLVFSDKSTMVWTGNGSGITYSVRRGTFGGGATWYNHTCFASGLTTPQAVDTSIPIADTGYYYLVAASNGGSSTNLGTGSSGQPRPPLVSCP